MLSKSVVLANFLKSLVAVVVGKRDLFPGDHAIAAGGGTARVARIDLGLVIDFWVCLVVFGLIELVRRRKRTGAGAK